MFVFLTLALIVTTAFATINIIVWVFVVNILHYGQNWKLSVFNVASVFGSWKILLFPENAAMCSSTWKWPEVYKLLHTLTDWQDTQDLRYTSQVTYIRKSGKFWGILLQIPANCPNVEPSCRVRRTYVLCLQNVHALSMHQCIICCLYTHNSDWLACNVANHSCKEDHCFPSRYS